MLLNLQKESYLGLAPSLCYNRTSRHFTITSFLQARKVWALSNSPDVRAAGWVRSWPDEAERDSHRQETGREQP